MLPASRRKRRPAVALTVVAIADGTLPECAAGAGSATDQRDSRQERQDIHEFAEVSEPGRPEGGIVVADGTVYVGTPRHVTEIPGGTSRGLACNPTREFTGEYIIDGQDSRRGAGAVGLVQDGAGIENLLLEAP